MDEFVNFAVPPNMLELLAEADRPSHIGTYYTIA
jgi:hypothetical protein